MLPSTTYVSQGELNLIYSALGLAAALWLIYIILRWEVLVESWTRPVVVGIAAIATAVILFALSSGPFLWKNPGVQKLTVSQRDSSTVELVGRSEADANPLLVRVRYPYKDEMDSEEHQFPVRESMFPWALYRWQLMLFKEPETWAYIIDINATDTGKKVMP